MKNTLLGLLVVVSLGFGAWGLMINMSPIQNSNLAQNNLAQVSATQTAFTPNIPTNEGLSLVGDTTFGEANVKENVQGAGGLAYGNWGGSSCKNVATTTPYGSSALEVSYPGNDLGNGVGGCWIEGTLGQKWTKLYFSMSVWVPANYSLHSNAEKFLYMHTTADGDPTLQGALIEWHAYGAGETPNGATFGLELNPNTASGVMYPNPYGGGPWYWIYQNIGSTRIKKGAWQNVEVYFQMNTPGKQDGVYKVWIEGNKVLEGTNALFRGGTTQGYFNGMRFDGTRGGGASSTPTPAGGQVRRYGRLAWYASGGTITPPVVTTPAPVITPPVVVTPSPTPTSIPETIPTPIPISEPTPTPTPIPDPIPPTPVPVIVPTSDITIGSTVYTTARLNVRSSASAYARRIGVQSTGAKGTIISGPTSANGYVWWKVNFTRGADGWVINSLKK